MNLTAEKPTDELTPSEMTVLMREAWMSALVQKDGQSRNFIVKRMGCRNLEKNVLVDVTFHDGSTVQLRIRTQKVKALIQALQDAIR